MATQPSAFFIAEVGTGLTRLTLVDLVDGDFRLVARAEAPSSIYAPVSDLTVALVQLAVTIEKTTGRQLVRDGRLLIPPDDDGHGVQRVAITTSAAGVLPIAIAALAAHQSARTAVQAAAGIYCTVGQILALDEAGTAGELWLGRELNMLLKLQPAAIVIAGGLEGSATGPMQRLAHLAGLLARASSQPPQIIYAGNSAAVPILQTALGNAAPVEIVDNLRPSSQTNRLAPTRAALRTIYTTQQIPQLAGYGGLPALGVDRVGLVPDDQGIMIRFLAERFGRNILHVDIGATHSNAQLQAEGHFSHVIVTGSGTGSGALQIADRCGAATLARWLPFDISEADLINRLLNRMVHPGIEPATLDDLLVDHALIREGISAALDALRAMRPEVHYDLVIAGGAIAHAPRPGLAALSLLDALAIEQQQGHLAIELYLDQFSLLAAGGALAYLEPDAAACLIEQDGLSNGPLATVVVPQGAIEAGTAVLEAELVSSQGDLQRMTVIGGQIARLPLARGQHGTLRIRPSAGVHIGDNPAGTEVLSDEAAIGGSALGVVIDARPRPLSLPDDIQTRQRVLIEWLTALDALPPDAPYIIGGAPSPISDLIEAGDPDADLAPAVLTPIPDAASAATVPANPLETDSAATVPTDPPQSADLAAMRETLIKPERSRRGFFRRRS